MRRERVFFDEKNSDLISLDLYQRGSTNARERKEMKRILALSLKEELTDRQRDCITMYYLQGLKMKDIAETLGISKSTVSRHIRSATCKLRHIAFYYNRAVRGGDTGAE